MTKHHSHDDDIVTNTSGNEHIADIIERVVANPSRRHLLKGGLGLSALGFFSLPGCGGGTDSNAATPASGTGSSGSSSGGTTATTLGAWSAVAKSTADTVTVPAGYTVSVLFRLGDPIDNATSAYGNEGTESGASFASRAGDHHDGMHYFGLGADGKYSPSTSDRGLLCINHEAITPAFLHANGVTYTDSTRTVRASSDEVVKEMNAHGVSVIEVRRSAGGTWSHDRGSIYNRRITTLTDMFLAGPAGGTSYMITKYSTNGTRTRGTINNCGNGYTPWGTYLTAEENWAGYFRRVAAVDNPKRTAKELTAFARYGVAGNGRELWATIPDDSMNTFGRWNAEKLGSSTDGSDDYRNVANTYGWVVEMDPFNPAAAPKKRTGMGRFAHEGAWPGRAIAGQPVVFYMGCDSRNEYIYKYVSNAVWNPADATGGMAAGDKYLDNGKLYVAKFNADGTGQWLELSFGVGNVTAANAAYPFADQADVLIHARLAADAAGATKMDRPEWAAVNPVNGEVYITLTNTNSSSRPIASTDAANPRFYNDVKGGTTNQRGNPNGHIIRFVETGGLNGATTFTWDIFLFGARSTAAANVNLSGLTAAQDFSSPDGLWFSPASNLLWLQTDDGAYTDVTNCMMLAAIPGNVGDGSSVTINNVDGATTKSVTTKMGATLPETRLRRFLVGPKECEITGIAESPDGKALFVNIQHPGEDTAPNFATRTYGSYWPDGGNSRPRSATIVITRNDGGVIGL